MLVFFLSIIIFSNFLNFLKIRDFQKFVILKFVILKFVILKFVILRIRDFKIRDFKNS